MARKQNSKDFVMEIKLEVIRMHFQEGKNRKEIQEELCIKNIQNIHNWIWLYKKYGIQGLNKGRKGRPSKKGSQRSEIEQLRMENDLLKKFHTELGKTMHGKRNIGLLNTSKANIP